MYSKNDASVLRELGKEYAEVANLPVQQEKVRLWKKLNALKPERPMVAYDQLPVNELAKPGDGQLDILCENGFLRRIESAMRLDLFKWRNFAGDMVILPYAECPPSVSVSGGHASISRTTFLKMDDTSDISSQHYDDMLGGEADLEKITDPVVNYDKAETEERMGALREIFDGVLDVRIAKNVMMCNMWDGVTTMRGVQNVCADLIDRPEFMHRTIDRMCRVYRSIFDQYAALDLLDVYPKYVHCTGAFTDELPKAGFDGRARPGDVWIASMAQMFSTVSPAMDKEFQLDYVQKYFGDAGLIYYGCCEPLHDRIHLIKQIKQVRKISTSPWADLERSAREIGGEAVLSRKPNPAFLAFQSFDDSLIRKELKETIDACRRHNTPCELILKDVSTVRYEPERLSRWNEIAMELVNS